MQGVCDMDKFFWNVCVGQPSDVHESGLFQYFNLYGSLQTCEILKELVVHIQNLDILPFILGDSTYTI